jgi:hypothetical protein
MTATKTMTEEEMFDDSENASFEIPDFEKMKVVDLKAFAQAELPVQAEELCKLKKADLIIALKNAFPHPDALDTPAVTGFDPMDPIHATVGEVQALACESDAIAYVYDLVDKNDFNFFKMGGALAEMLTHGWMGEYDDFGAMVEGEFGFKNRKALYLISIYHAIVTCGASWNEVKKIGWSKLGILATSLTPENYKQWFEKVVDINFATTRELVKAKDETGNPPPADANAESTPKVTLKFVVHEDQLENIKEALKKAKEMGNTEFDGPALDWICIDYLAGGSILAQAPLTEAKAAVAEDENDMTPGEFFTYAIEKLIASEEADPLKALVIGTDAFEAAYGVVYPDLDFDVYTDGKPDTDELADDDA